MTAPVQLAPGLAAALLLGTFVPILAQQAPSTAASAPITEQEKDRQLRGPAPEDEYLSSLTPDARAKSGFEVLSEGGESPFGMATALLEEISPTRRMSEEQKLRSVLSKIRVSGRMGEDGSYRVLLGPMLVGVGDVLQPIFVNQVERLKVQSISDRGVVLEFVEKEQTAEPRTIGLPYDLRPRADSLLAGELFLKMIPLNGQGDPVLPPLVLPSVENVMTGIEQGNMQSLVERPVELMNAPALRESNEAAEE